MLLAEFRPKCDKRRSRPWLARFGFRPMFGTERRCRFHFPAVPRVLGRSLPALQAFVRELFLVERDHSLGNLFEQNDLNN